MYSTWIVIQSSQPAALLDLVGDLRDNVLPELGVRLEDRQGEKAVVKLVDKDELLRERELERAEKAEKEAKKLEDKRRRVRREGFGCVASCCD